MSVPQTILALGVICADTEAKAQRLNASMRLRRVIRELGADPGSIPTPEEALARLGPGPDRAAPDEGEWPRYIVGARSRCTLSSFRMATELRVDELMVVTVVHDHEARRRSHQLLAEIFGLAPRAQGRGIPRVR